LISSSEFSPSDFSDIRSSPSQYRVLLATLRLELLLAKRELLVLDSAVLLAFPASNPRDEGKLLKIVRGDEIRVAGSVLWFEVSRCFARTGFNENDEFVIGELQNEFVILAKTVPNF